MAQQIDIPNVGIVEFPDGMSDAQIKMAAQKLSQQGQPPQSSGQRQLSDLIAGKPAPLSRMDRFLKGIRDPIDAGAQMLVNALPQGVVNAGDALQNMIAEKTGLMSKLPEGGSKQLIADQERQYQQRRAASGDTGMDWMRVGGNILSPANLAVASRVSSALPAATSLAGRVGLGATTGATAGALTPVSDGGDFATEKMKQILYGGLGGGAMPMLGAGAGRIISPLASKNETLKKLMDEGVTPTIGQALGGAASRMEEKMQSIPILGDMITSARKNANQSFETAAYNRALEPIGAELPSGMSGREALNYTENALKESYNNVLDNIGAIRPDQKMADKIGQLTQMLNQSLLPKAEKQKFQMVVNDVKNSIDQNGVITSDMYKMLESSLGDQARKLASSTNIYEGKTAEAVKQLQQELRDMLGRQAGPMADDLAAVNAGWANFKRVQNAASKVGAEEGKFSPAQFQAAVRAMDKSKDKAAFARGDALGQDLADAGKAILSGKTPDSGTAGRMLLNAGVLGGGAALSPTTLLGGIGASGLYLPAAQKALVSSVVNRPQSAEAIAQAIQNASPYLGMVSSPIMLPLLQQQK